MQKLQCELCGSIDIIKTADNVFQCQHCGCKYTLQQAKTLIMGGEVKTKATDFEIVGGVLKKYNGESVDVVIPDNVLIIEEKVFENLPIRSIILSKGLKEIRKAAFRSCTLLQSATLSKDLELIGDFAFDSCKALTSIIIPKGVTHICKYAFHGCEALTSIQLPDELAEIEESAFEGCKSLQSINIPNRLKLQWGAFFNCSSLKNLYIPDDVIYHYGDSIILGHHKDEYFMLDDEKNIARIFTGCDYNSFSTPFSRKKKKDEIRMQDWINNGKCRYCGGNFKGLFTKTCSICGREKDY